ncbi:DUF4129 domain-containing protein [Paenibacillus endophyticus]|nr:DUF4129 domain-containing protein [Paenibacillus endophyticus]
MSHPFKFLGQGIVELLFYLPIVLIAAVYLLPEPTIWLWIVTFPLGYLAGSLATKKRASMRYGARLLLAVAIGCAHGSLAILSGGDSVILAFSVAAILSSIMVFRGMSGQLKGWTASFPNTQMLVGVIMYVAIQPLKLMVFKKLIPLNGLLIVCGIVCVILFFFFANERHLNSETSEMGKSSATVTFKRQNRIMMIVIVLLIAIIALFRQIQQAIERFFHQIADLIMSWLNRPKEETSPAEQLPDAAPPQMPVEEIKPPSDWMLLLEQIAKIVGIVLAIAAACILIYFIAKKVIKWVRLVIAKLQERGAENRGNNGGYIDEVEKLTSLNSWREQLGNELKKRFQKKRNFAEEWDELFTNAEKIRFLYARNVRAGAQQGYVAKAHLTPRETAEELAEWQAGKLDAGGLKQLVEVYEEVRYGDKSAKDELVDRLKQPFVKNSKE